MLVLLAWIACSVFVWLIATSDFVASAPSLYRISEHRKAYPRTYGYNQSVKECREKLREVAGFAALIAFTGPIGLVIGLCVSGFVQHGLFQWFTAWDELKTYREP